METTRHCGSGDARDRMSPARHGACSSMAERLTVDEEVAGSKPVRHPPKTPGAASFSFMGSHRSLSRGDRQTSHTTP